MGTLNLILVATSAKGRQRWRTRGTRPGSTIIDGAETQGNKPGLRLNRIVTEEVIMQRPLPAVTHLKFVVLWCVLLVCVMVAGCPVAVRAQTSSHPQAPATGVELNRQQAANWPTRSY